MRNIDIPTITYTSQSETASIYIGDEDFVVVDKSCTVVLPDKVHTYTGKVITIIANADCSVLNTEMGVIILLPRNRLVVVAIAEQWVKISLTCAPISEPIYIEDPLPIEEKVFASV
jgi:hypothetical protein